MHHLTNNDMDALCDKHNKAVKKLTQQLADKDREMIKFADYLEKLSPSDKVSVWSKDGQSKGLFNMDNEQLLEKFKRIPHHPHKGR